MSLSLDSAVRVAIIVAAGLAAVLGLGRRSAAVRHWVLVVSIGCGAALPLLQLVLPSWHTNTPRFWTTGSPEAQVADVTVALRIPATATIGAAASQGSGHSRPRSFSATSLMVLVWLAGALMSVAMLLVGLWRIARLTSSARRVETGPLAATAQQIREALNIHRGITLLQSAEPHLLGTWGVVRPRVILPREASQWSDDRTRVVLHHELAHIARGDWVTQMLAETLRAVYWFNPLLWVACRRLRDESERACDDVVLRAGVRPSEYASHLLDLARDAARPGIALGMARSSSLEGRVHAMLNAQKLRHPIGLTARVATLVAFTCVTAPLATAQSGHASVRGAVLDQTNRYVPGAAVVLTSSATNAASEARTDQTGHFEFPDLSPGDYQLVIQKPGFKSFNEAVTVSGGDVTRNIKLQIGTVQETLNINASAAESAPQSKGERRNQFERSRQRAQEARLQADQKCSAGAPAGDIGGEIVPPLKLTNVRPEYPATLKASGIEGDVTLNALIGTDGTVSDVTVLSSPHPELERVAIDAVRRWEFSTTYLNCTPVEVPMRVNLRFVAPQ